MNKSVLGFKTITKIKNGYTMLAPNAQNVYELLTDSYNNLLNLDALAYSSMNTLVGKLSPDPAWLGQIRNRMALFSDQGSSWQQLKPDIWSEILSPFNTYYALFSGFSEVRNTLKDDKDAWKACLSQLSTNLKSIVTKVEAAEVQFNDQLSQLRNVESLLSDCLDEAWTQLSNEEQNMISLATEIGSLQTKLTDLESNLSATEIRDGANYTKTAATISYAILTSTGETIPYLSIVSLFYTVGDLIYNLIVTSSDINDTINKIVELRNEMTAEAQAAAMTKALIQMINNFDKKMLTIESKLPNFSALWSCEQSKIDEVINAINAGANPSDVLSLVTMPAACEVWQQLSGFVDKFATPASTATPISISILDGESPIQQIA